MKSRLGGNQRLRRRWLTWLRMTRYGANNFTRNAWLTTAATAVMTITLLIIFMTFIARQALVSTVDELRQKVDISIYLRNDIEDDEVKEVIGKFKATENVESVRYIDIEEAKQTYIDQNKPSAEQLHVDPVADDDGHAAPVGREPHGRRQVETPIAAQPARLASATPPRQGMMLLPVTGRRQFRR